MKSVEERFFDKIIVGESCWDWSAKKDKNGYGRFSPNGMNSQMPAHRFSWELHNGPIPEGMFVCHRCDNPSCTNPEHLFLGTPQDNMSDKVAKGRWKGAFPRRPKKTLTRKPTALDRLEPFFNDIKAMRDGGSTLKSIADRFGCDKKTVGRLLSDRGEYTPLKPGPRTPFNVRSAEIRKRAAEIFELHRSGASSGGIAKTMGTSNGTILRILKAGAASGKSIK
jgi:hypothetical protein